MFYAMLPGDSTWLEIQNLVAKSDNDPDTVRQVLHLIWEYGLINYR